MAKKNKFERLIDLIHKGKTRAIRTVAAIQIGHLQKEFSYDLSYILFKLYPLFLDNDFECRRAAGIALENLIPLSRPNFQSWNVNRPFMKLKSFNLEDIIQKCEPLLRGTSTSIPSFHVDEESRLSELCQISEDMIPKLTSQRWEFRHGAVQCLLRSIQSHVPSDYLEDLSVRVFTLLALDRFKDFSGDMVVFPVVEPASHLLARCLMQNVQSGLDILEQFRLRKSTDDWGLRQSFWIVVHHMLKVDKNCIDPNWLQPRLFEAFSEAGDADEVTAAALKAVMKILPYFSQIDQITSGIWELLINSEDIDPYNYPCLKALKVIIEKCQFSEFIDEDTFSIVTHCQYPSIATRRASYLLLESLFSLKDHEVYEDFDFHQYTLQLFNCSLNERDKEIYSLSIHVINKYQELMRYRGIYFDSTFAVKVCDYLAEDIQKLPNIMPLLIELAHYLEVNDEHPVFKNCKSIWKDYIRRMASHSLAQIVKLLPLDDGDLSIFPDNLHNAKIKSMKYLKPLFDISQAPKCILNPLPNFESIPNGKIKDYQVNGINWLWFLYQYGLNGILADDMGLGKTFQCLSVISNAHTKENFETNSNSAFSIIVCPSSIIHHWASETQQFYPQINVNPIYSKTELNVQNFHMMNGLLIISYQNVRNLIPIIRQRKFVYCVLDEGHIIKNKSTKVSEAVVQIIAQHRLILTGTPIQNNVTELWTLMDFLMPGFLGTKEEFQTKYQRPIKKMFKPEATELETELGQQILTSLHNQVLPFIMRRLKINVMSELPPKVIYDEVFKMTDKQREVLQSIRSKHAINSDDEINEHTFVKMKKERKLCIHPCLVDPSIPHLLEYSAKLKELKSLLLSRLGFGGGKTSMRNRVLIFTQSTQTIEITVEILLSKIEGLTYTILDGNVAERDRHKIIDNFNKEDGPDILLLTTSVGGLGLNLQVANIVIFMENSWNFTDDDQAIARAHRMGQTKQVTVFNLITDETIESRILETQKQKRKVAQAIINDENEDVQGNAGEIFKDDEIEIKKPANEKRLTMAQIANMQQQDEDPNQYKEDYRQQDEMWKRY
ncbi:SNF2 family protein [Histomonas meleagridis]|uniref:SNF2 family protein n=1 Tax=Histomonas meleagridis TaxID=135588 RepID=UPI00355A67CA|nr:SNF2 family protein [Histomonas meleagridis]KAH0804810.1 SNF2 family protein [Histomonas meleagridis]